jgi:hypothetical protein
MPGYGSSSPQTASLPQQKSMSGHWERHVFPEIGKLPIDEIKKPWLQALFDYLSIDGYSKSTIKIIKGR